MSAIKGDSDKPTFLLPIELLGDFASTAPMRIQTPYDEHYGTCSYTHAWLRVMSPELDPDEITRLLGVEPTDTQRAGEPWPPVEGRKFKRSAWFLSTKDILTSLDARHHLNWLLERVGTKQAEFAVLHSRGYLVDVCCRWDSKSGHGGPTLSPSQMEALAALQVEL